MTDKELYVLNRAIDGEDIYMLPTRDELPLSEINIRIIKEGLILKHILYDYNTLTAKGVSMIKKLKSYKNSKKYFSINNVTIGISDGKDYVMLLYNPLVGEYKIEYIKETNWLDDIFGFYIFINNSNNCYVETSVALEESLFESLYKVDSRHAFTIKVNINGEVYKYKILEYKEALYLYEYNQKLLHKRRKDNLKAMLMEKVGVLWE